jgi:pimeloyl-ACP methyl ester carboxylesterase
MAAYAPPAVRHPAYGHVAPRRTGLAGGKGRVALAATGVALAAAALWVNHRARQAEREHPPLGRFLEVDGVRLHYAERGQGQPVVLLHGNGSMIEDLAISGVVDRLAERYRVIAFDRPGYGHSSRPRDRIWTPDAQAEVLLEACRRLGVQRPIVVGHSWGTLVTMAMALHHQDELAGIVLLSGYYFPTARVDVPLFAAPALPVIGDVMRHTISPLIGRAMWPRLKRRIFAPAPVAPQFEAGFPTWMALRPSQLRAAASETALMIPAAAAMRHHYGELRLPVVIAAGADDQYVDTWQQSAELHRLVPASELLTFPRVGHMVYHTAPRETLEAIDLAARRVEGRTSPALGAA